jgi:hypothetical protein
MKNNYNGIGLLNCLQINFITLKLCNLIDWSWWLVLIPLWIVLVPLVIIHFSDIPFLLYYYTRSKKTKQGYPQKHNIPFLLYYYTRNKKAKKGFPEMQKINNESKI